MTNPNIPALDIDAVLTRAAELIRDRMMVTVTQRDALPLAQLIRDLEQVKIDALHALDFHKGLTAYMTGGAPTHNPFLAPELSRNRRTASWQNGFMAGKTVDLSGRERNWMRHEIETLQGQLLDAIDAGGVVPHSCEATYTMLSMAREHVREFAAGPEREATALPVRLDTPVNFQVRVQEWIKECFGDEVYTDPEQRRHRFLEEALELVQASGGTLLEVEELAQYVFGRPVGETQQEVGGVMLTLAGFCGAHGIDMAAAGETELERVWLDKDKIRQKQAARVEGSALPGRLS